MEYRLLIDLEVIDTLDQLPKKPRRRLLEQFRRIRSFPSNSADYHEYDSNGRRIHICIFSGWAIHFWEDSADRHVKILALNPADKP
jgi:hypothetical protein